MSQNGKINTIQILKMINNLKNKYNKIYNRILKYNQFNQSYAPKTASPLMRSLIKIFLFKRKNNNLNIKKMCIREFLLQIESDPEKEFKVQKVFNNIYK